MFARGVVIQLNKIQDDPGSVMSLVGVIDRYGSERYSRRDDGADKERCSEAATCACARH